MNKQPIPEITLSNGVTIPHLGFGVAELKGMETIESAIHTALDCGYRFFDDAPFYENEPEVGKVLRESGVRREELFICSKLPNACHAYDKTLRAFDASMKAMGLDYLDMYLIHFPVPSQDLFCDAWRAMERLYREGVVKVIGLSNFMEPHIQKILDHCEIVPQTIELEVNPYYTTPNLRKKCRDNQMHVINWFPLGGPAHPLIPYPEYEDKRVLLEDVVIEEIAKKYGKTNAQVILRWAVENGMTPIPKSSKPHRIAENCDIFDFRLTPEEVARIDALNHDRRFGPDNYTYDDMTMG